MFSSVFVFSEPHGETFSIVVGPQPGESFRSGVFVGVHSLPLFKVEFAGGQRVKRVLGLGFFNRLFILNDKLVKKKKKFFRIKLLSETPLST